MLILLHINKTFDKFIVNSKIIFQFYVYIIYKTNIIFCCELE